MLIYIIAAESFLGSTFFDSIMKMLFTLLALLLVVPVSLEAKVYRFSPQGALDMTAAVVRAARIMRNGDRIVFQRGTYHFRPDSAALMGLWPSNNTGGVKHVVFPLVGKDNISIDGGGSTFVFSGGTFPFAVIGCRNISIGNFSVTTENPPAVKFDVVEKDDSGFCVKMGNETKWVADEEGNVIFSLGGRSVRSRDGRISMHATDCININYLMTPASAGDKNEFPASFVGVKIKDIGGGKMRCSYYGDKHPKSIPMPYAVGQPVVLNLAEKRLEAVCFIESSDGVRVKRVNVKRFGGMCFVAQRSGNIRYDRLSVMPPEGTSDVTATADIFQCINCYGKVVIENCKAGYSLDDAVNVHGNYLVVTNVKGRYMNLKAMHMQHEKFFPYRPGDEIEITEPHTRRLITHAKVSYVKESETSNYDCQLVTDRDLDSVPVGSLVENITLCPNVVLKNNVFTHFPNIRLSGRGKILYKNNRISYCCCALVAFDLADYWYEAGRLSKLIVRDNVFNDCNALGGGSTINVGMSGWGDDAPKIHGTVVIKDNAVSGKSGPFIIQGVKNVEK